MILFKIQCTAQLREQFQKHRLSPRIIQQTCTLICNRLYRRKKHKSITLKFSHCTCKLYTRQLYGTCNFYFAKYTNRNQLIKDILHEFRHWLQWHMERIHLKDMYDITKITNDYDPAYWRHPIEKDARRFTAKHLKTFKHYVSYFSIKD